MPLRVDGPDSYVSPAEKRAVARERAKNERKRKVRVRRKPPAVPSLTIDFENPPPTPRPYLPVGPTTSKPQRHGGHLPTPYEYVSPEQLGHRALGVETAAERRASLRKNQWRERRRRDEAEAMRAAEKAAREQRRKVVRSLPEKARNMIGRDKLQTFIQTGGGLEKGFGTDEIKGIGKGLYGAVRAGQRLLAEDPLAYPEAVYDVGDWWVNRAPAKLLGKYEKGKGYQGGAAGAWDAMTTEEQIDTIAGGKSLANVLQGQNLSPENIGRAVALAAMAPIPFGKGLPSLASVLLRAGMSVPEAKIALQTGRGLSEAIQTLKKPVLSRVVKGKEVPRYVRALQPEDADVFDTWKPEAQRRGHVALAAAKKGRMPTLALTDEKGKLRAVAAYTIDDEALVVNQLAGSGRGGGRAMMRELAEEASSLGLGIRLIADDPKARTFYENLGMKAAGEHGFTWTPKQVKAFVKEPDPVYKPRARLLDTAEAERMQPEPGMWFHGTTQAAIVSRLRDEAESAGRSQLPERVVLTTPEQDYRSFLDKQVRASGKGARGVTTRQREEMEREMLKYANRYPDDPDFDEFWRLYHAVNPVRDDDIPWGEAGRLTLGGGRSRPGVRTLRAGDKVQQMQGARSAITRNLIERPADWTSTKLADEESRAAGLLRKMFPTADAPSRVAKQAGRQQIIEASRANARMMNHVHRLPDSGSPEDIAHFYWAQLPAAERNAQGLQRVRDAQAVELERIASGDALAEVEDAIAATHAELAETQDLALLRQSEELKVLAADLPRRAEDLSASMAQLDALIASPPKYDPKIVEAVRGLSVERRNILEEAGVLDEERGEAREGLFSSWLGLEPTGEEAYIGHRLGKVWGAQPSLMPVSPGVGRARAPQGVRQRNALVLARSGRLRASTHVAAEDWQAAQTYEAALKARDDLALMGKPFEGRLPEGYMLVNPRGRAIPAHWKALPAFDELDDEQIRKAASEVMDGFLADGMGADALIAAAKEAGVNWDELRIVPERIVKRYYGQFTPAGGATKAGKAYDAAVDFTAASIVFARVGYIPKNIAQNLIISVPHQGPFLLVNAPRAAHALTDPDLRHLLQAEVGFSGATQGIGEELRFGQKFRGIPGKAAGFVGKIADDPARISAFLHEAAAVGVISKYNPHLTAKDKAALMHLLTDELMRPLLNDIRSRSVEAMADFSRLTPTQRRWARRFLIIPGWLWAGSRYPFHFAATHPVRSAAIGYAAAGAPGLEDVGGPDLPSASELFSDNLPPFIEGIDLPDSFPVFGGKTFRTTSLSPVSTPYEIALALGGQSPDTAVSYANPLAKSLYNMAGRKVEYPGGSYQTGYQEAIVRNLERLLPNWTFVKDTVSPDGSGYYPEDESRLGRFFRELGVVPIKVVGEKEKDDSEWIDEVDATLGGLPPERRAEAEQSRKAYVAHEEAKKAYEKELGIESGEGGMTPQERLVVLVRTQAALNPDKAAAAKGLEKKAMTLSDDAAEDAISAGRGRMGLTRYNQILDRVSAARQDSRTNTR